ncbi:MAG: hypothetical protein PHF40_01685 [Candidatus Pacebacteria bacterium]|nr:hypothetical protein [Candidatus Paceibacterota bacterium]
MKAENIYVEINDSVSEVVEKIINSTNEAVILIIPENARISESILNFRLIKREADAANKKIYINSDAEEVLLMAKESGIKIVELSQMSRPSIKNQILIGDIRPPQKNKNRVKKTAEPIFNGVEKEETKNEVSAPKEKKFFTDYFDKKSFSEIHISEKEIRRERKNKEKKSFRFGKGGWIALGIVAFLFIASYLFINFVARAEINIVSNKYNWNEQLPILVTSNIKEVDFGNFQIPLTHFEGTRTITQKFPATEIKNIEAKAKGTIRIYNSYSSSPQTLVATTRFMTPDGKIFRLINQVVVPGAKIENGNIIPSYIDAEVIADQPGESYNIGPTKFTIPGFQGTPRYEKFYAESLKPMTGGYTGQTKVVGQEDINNAKKKIADIAYVSLNEELQTKLPAKSVILDDAKQLIVTSVTTTPQLGEKAEEFEMTAKVVLKVLAFKEDDVKQLFNALALRDNPGWQEKELFSYHFEYGVPRVDFDKKLLSFPVSATLVFRDPVDVNQFKNQLAGKSTKDLNQLFKQYKNIEKINVYIWPKFLEFLPLNESRIKVTLDGEAV